MVWPEFGWRGLRSAYIRRLKPEIKALAHSRYSALFDGGCLLRGFILKREICGEFARLSAGS